MDIYVDVDHCQGSALLKRYYAAACLIAQPEYFPMETNHSLIDVTIIPRNPDVVPRVSRMNFEQKAHVADHFDFCVSILKSLYPNATICGILLVAILILFTSVSQRIAKTI